MNRFNNPTTKLKSSKKYHKPSTSTIVGRQKAITTDDILNTKTINHITNSNLSPLGHNLNLSQSHSPVKPCETERCIKPINQIPIQTFNGSNTSNSHTNVKVMCRFRPLSDKEKQITKELCYTTIDDTQVEIKSKHEYNNFPFHFDRIFNVTSTQKEIYDYSTKDLVDSVLDGYNATIFAYGQTASGKTYTMQGIIDNPEKEGVIPRMVRHIFHQILCSDGDILFTVTVSMLELYMEKVRDLLDVTKVNLNIRETKEKVIYIEDLSEYYVATEEDILEYIGVGNTNRKTSATMMNENSNRSHTMLIITIHQKNNKTLEAKCGKLYMVDLAGSEKITKTGSSGITLEEAKIINKSLTTLGMVINALTDGKSSHIPYRESKLTRILTESLGGNAKTCLIITCSPSQYNESETLSTLRFGTRAKRIKNKPKINKEVTVAELKLQIEKLEQYLVICTNRMGQLEEFITSNGLTVPLDSEYNFIPSSCNNNDNNTSPMRDDTNNIDNNELTSKMKEIESKYASSISFNHIIDNNSTKYNEQLEEVKLKIKDLQAIIDQKEKIEDEFDLKEQNYKNTISQLSESLKSVQSIELIKNNLKLIDKRTLDELHSQLKDHLINQSKSNPKNTKDYNNRILDSLSSIINNNTTAKYFTITDQKKLSQRLSYATTNKLEYIAGHRHIVDYKDFNDNLSLSTEAMLKEKNDRIKRLEADLKEYKDRVNLLESKLTPDEKNLHKKIYTLEKSLEQVNDMYQKVITKKSVLNIENEILEKKVKKRNEKIDVLIKENNGLIEQLKMRDDKLMIYQKGKNSAIPQVVKVLRGVGKGNNVINMNSMALDDMM